MQKFSQKKIIKIYEENIRPNLTGDDKNLEYMQFLFRSTKEQFKDDKLFEQNEIPYSDVAAGAECNQFFSPLRENTPARTSAAVALAMAIWWA